MITRGEELTLTAVRYLRRCLLEGDIEALIAAQFNPSDYELLDDPTHFIKSAQGQPTARPTDHTPIGARPLTWSPWRTDKRLQITRFLASAENRSC